VRVPTPSSRPKVARLTRRRDIDRLIKAARYRDFVRDVDGRAVDVAASVRHDAIIALASFDDPRITEVAIEALDDEHSEVRRAAIFAIRCRKDLDAARQLAERVPSWISPDLISARSDALDALLELDDPSVAEPLAIALAHSPFDPPADTADLQTLEALVMQDGGRDVAAGTAASLADQIAAGAEAGRLEAMVGVLAALGEGAVEPLVHSLDDDRTRPYAARALGRIRSPQAVDPLIDVLADTHRPGRADAAWGLGEIQDPRAIMLLFRATVDPDYAVRSAAVAALERFGATAVVVGVAAIFGGSGATLRPDPELPGAEFGPPPLPVGGKPGEETDNEHPGAVPMSDGRPEPAEWWLRWFLRSARRRAG
jgi:HEAT repeat protein